MSFIRVYITELEPQKATQAPLKSSVPSLLISMTGTLGYLVPLFPIALITPDTAFPHHLKIRSSNSSQPCTYCLSNPRFLQSPAAPLALRALLLYDRFFLTLIVLDSDCCTLARRAEIMYALSRSPGVHIGLYTRCSRMVTQLLLALIAPMEVPNDKGEEKKAKE